MSQENQPSMNSNAKPQNASHHHKHETVRELQMPEPTYRLRISVLKDGEGSRDCIMRMFIFNSYESLQSAVTLISNTFGGAFSEYKITKGGLPLQEDSLQAGEVVEDGRTEDVVLAVDTQTADESWHEFLGRLDKMESGWQEEELGIRNERGGSLKAGGVTQLAY